ncbi:hypothetical protein [Candidatus Palauibacter polyketidifaciens]|uniref:hypothetical protein n=1 Tax=Candidatus Palauibacter polyketidifaciens TaxID=3056740 RepID=UPI00139D0895|nr:hypothetical protein [Candidatus Palauibacter polyketidifaciens]MDE2720824.1 hypothetical protein [Candidatus Palauibacter polyketidifaciens]MYE34579.1 hypothetical protein [Gemmatimonadales bacterium]
MDAERQRSAYGELLTALDEAIFWLARVPAAEPHESGAERQGTFRLGEAGGIAFSAHFPGMDSEALFDDISDAVERDDLDAVRRVRSLVESRLRSEDDGTGGEETAGDAFDWDAGYLQILGVLNETRRARDDGDAHRYWIMAGFLAGLLHWDERPGEHEPGELHDTVIAATSDGWGENLWLEWEALRDEWLARHAPEAPEDPELLFSWLGLRLAAADVVTDSLSSRGARRPGDQPSDPESEEVCFLRCERSTWRAQHFGRKLADPRDEGGGLAIDG